MQTVTMQSKPLLTKAVSRKTTVKEGGTTIRRPSRKVRFFFI